MAENNLMGGISSTLSSFTKMFPKRQSTTAPATDDYSFNADSVVSSTPSQYAGIITSAAKKYGLSSALLSSVIKKESGFNANASNVNPKEKSYGLAQINLNAHPDVTETQAKDPNFSIDYAAKRLKAMTDKYGTYEGIQAYNTPGAVGSDQLKKYANEILTTAKAFQRRIPQLTGKFKTTNYTNSSPMNILKSVGTQTTNWGESTKYEKFHPGIDVANKIGTPVPSTLGGVVTKIISGKKHGDNGYGNQVEITDQWGNKHRYSHLSQQYVRVGQKVGKGQAIGAVGDSGSTYSASGSGTGAHLDYRIVDSFNKYINPYTYLNKNTK